MWRNKLEQLVGLLQKVPQARTFDSKAGVYQPYFVIELRTGNWEVVPYASYTRIDGTPGREVRLSLSVVDSSKVDIRQPELDCVAYLEAIAGAASRSIFNYTQPVGYLLDWLRDSQLRVKEQGNSEPHPLSVCPRNARIILRLSKVAHAYRLQPTLSFDDGQFLTLEKAATVLTSNPVYLLYDSTLYRIESELPAVFWNNYFRTRERLEIPCAELGEFIRLYLPHILPVLNWDHLGDEIREERPPVSGRLLCFAETSQQLQIEVMFEYGKTYQFPAYPPADRSLAQKGSRLSVIRRNRATEERYRKLLQENGLIYSSGSWHIAVDYHHLDWMRLVLPRLRKSGFKIIGEEKLKRFRVHRGEPRLHMTVRSGNDWFDLNYSLRLGRKTVHAPDLLKQLEQGDSYLRQTDGSYIFLPDGLAEKIKTLSRLLDFKDGSGFLRLPFAGITLLNSLKATIGDVRLDSFARQSFQRFESFQSIEPQPVPRQFLGTLREYQRHGLDWLYFLHSFRFGGILADDMGLGKTVQVISLLLRLQEAGSLARPVLVVAPVTLLFNWREEIRKFAPQLKVITYQGGRSERRQLFTQFAGQDLILCSYGVVLQDQKRLSTLKFGLVILDESQKIKNPLTKTYKSVCRLQSAHRLALTGTPLENSLTDLWAQSNFVNPGLLGTLKEFQKRFVDVEDEIRQEQLGELRKIIHPFILRRTKGEVEKQLPPLTEIIQYVAMTERQSEFYWRAVQAYRSQVFASIDSEGLGRTRLKIVEALTYLRQITCHPAILDSGFDLLDAGKMRLLEDILQDLLIRGHKVLIFSQFVRFLALVRKLFDQQGWRYEYLDGKVRDRESRIRNFQNNPDVTSFLISLKAGGLGLNLTAADYVIHLDPWWNPAVERQASDRAHRIGQTQRVFVYKFIVRNSVEEKILELQKAKKKLAEQMIVSDGGFVKQLTREDLEMLFEQKPS